MKTIEKKIIFPIVRILIIGIYAVALVIGSSKTLCKLHSLID